MDKLITVILPIYNVSEFVLECISSVLEQKHANIEIIMVDDGSSDLSPSIVDRVSLLCAREGRRIISVHQKNGGLSAARNTGLMLASGEYVAFIDSDDEISHYMFSVLLLEIDKFKADIAVCDYCKCKDRLDNSETVQDSRLFSTEEALKSCIRNEEIKQVVWNKLYKRSLLESLYFRFGKMSEDEFFTYRVIAKANKLIKISNIYYFYRQQDGSIMHSPFSLKWLDALEAKVERQSFIDHYFPTLTVDGMYSIIKTCVWDCQEAIKTLDGTDKKYAFQKLKAAMKHIELSNELFANKNLKEVIWLIMFKIALIPTCYLRNWLKIGQ